MTVDVVFIVPNNSKKYIKLYQFLILQLKLLPGRSYWLSHVETKDLMLK